MTRILEADQTGAVTIPPELLGGRAGARYVVETEAQSSIRIRPEGLPSHEVSQPSSDAWVRAWAELAEQIGLASSTDRSAVEMLSETRR